MARIRVYTIRLMGPELKEGESVPDFDQRNVDQIGRLTPMLDTMVQEINEALDTGYFVKIED